MIIKTLHVIKLACKGKARNIPAGTYGDVLAVRNAEAYCNGDVKEYLVKFPKHSWPISVLSNEVERYGILK